MVIEYQPIPPISVPSMVPFTHKDGAYYVEILKALIKYLDRMVDELNKVNEDWGSTINAAIDQINASVKAELERVETMLSEQTAEVDGKLASNISTVDAKIAEMVNYVNVEIGKIIGTSIEVNDTVIAQIVTNALTETRRELDELYRLKDSEVADVINNPVSLTRKALDGAAELVASEVVANSLEISHADARLVTILSLHANSIVFLGDSTIGQPGVAAALVAAASGAYAPMRLRPREQSPSPTIVNAYNLGIGGSQSHTYVSADNLARIREIRPRLALHMIGLNDWKVGRSPEDFAKNVAAAVDSIDVAATRSDNLHVMVNPHERVDVTNNIPWEAYFEAVKEKLSDRKNVLFVDCNPAMKRAGVGKELGNAYNLLSPDSVHLTPQGREVFAKVVMSGLGVFGGNGTDWVDFSQYKTPAVVELKEAMIKVSGDVVHLYTQFSADYTIGKSVVVFRGLPVAVCPAYNSWGELWGANNFRARIMLNAAGEVTVYPDTTASNMNSQGNITGMM